MTAPATDYIGKYELRRQIGGGATSAVFLAWDPFRQTEVAIKRLRREILDDPQRGRLLRQLFLNEAAFAGKPAPCRSRPCGEDACTGTKKSPSEDGLFAFG